MAKHKPSPFRRSPLRSQEKTRYLTAVDLDVAPDPAEFATAPDEPEVPEVPDDEEELKSELTPNDTLYRDIERLLQDGYAGVILAGPPGTSKSWYAHQIGILLAGNSIERFRSLQFHPAYQYEDFVQGYVPRVDGDGFRLRKKHLLQMCEIAERPENVGKRCVIVIDELSRADPGRVFGESLTYIEMTKRGQAFELASGTEISIPGNLVFLATMNTLDRGVDEIDIAFERRFARIEMSPSPAILEMLLTKKGMHDLLRKQVLGFFGRLMKHENEYCRIGHAYFANTKTFDDLQRLWNHQLRFTLEKACRLRVDSFRVIEKWWREMILDPAAELDDGQQPGTDPLAGLPAPGTNPP